MDFLAFFDGLFASASVARSGAEVSEDTSASQGIKVDSHVENTKAAAHEAMAHKRKEKMQQLRKDNRAKRLRKHHQNQHKR